MSWAWELAYHKQTDLCTLVFIQMYLRTVTQPISSVVADAYHICWRLASQSSNLGRTNARIPTVPRSVSADFKLMCHCFMVITSISAGLTGDQMHTSAMYWCILPSQHSHVQLRGQMDGLARTSLHAREISNSLKSLSQLIKGTKQMANLAHHALHPDEIRN